MDPDVSESVVYERLMNSSIRFISFRPRSEKEIRDFLERKLEKTHTTAPLVIGRILRRLVELGYLDDREFARWWVDQRTGRKPKGRRSIALELASKGVSRELIDEVLIHDDAREIELAGRLVGQKMRLWGSLPEMVRKRKLAEYLTRRGFAHDTARRAVDERAPKE